MICEAEVDCSEKKLVLTVVLFWDCGRYAVLIEIEPGSEKIGHFLRRMKEGSVSEY